MPLADIKVPAGDGDDHPLRICLRADFSFPLRDSATVYFEVTILHAESTTVQSSRIVLPLTVTLGFCGEFCDQTAAHPGWNVWSVGYHGNNGCIYEEYSQWMRDTGCKFGTGSTVGCGIDYAREEYFFTLDGKTVGMSPLESFVPLYERNLLSY